MGDGHEQRRRAIRRSARNRARHHEISAANASPPSSAASAPRIARATKSSAPKAASSCDPAFEYAEGLGYELTIGEKKQRKKFAKSDQFAPELVHFAKCVRANRRPEPSGMEGLIDVAIIEAIHDIDLHGWLGRR